MLHILWRQLTSASSVPGDKNRWMLNDKFVESPHTSSFYYESRPTTLSSKTTGYDIDGFMEAARYWYNGEERDARMFNEEMNEARELIEPIVRDTLAQRPVSYIPPDLLDVNLQTKTMCNVEASPFLIASLDTQRRGCKLLQRFKGERRMAFRCLDLPWTSPCHRLYISRR
jgi:hypothetical protein